ncbi:MAG: hypothetical protein AAGF54_18755 [Pseudomonadota bacterium]
MVTKEEKYARKRFLMDLGLKDHPSLSEPSQRVQSAYRIAHACFDCRKSYKIEIEFAGETPNVKCPQCSENLHYMGRSFKTPKQTDVKQWAKVKKLYEAGFVFFSYRHFPEAEPLPERLQDVDDFLARNPDHPMKVG